MKSNQNELLMTSDTNVEFVSDALKHKKIGLVCSGGIAAIETPKIARELRRHGAEVFVFVTKKSLEFVGIKSLEWASQNPVVEEPTGLAEHICTMDALLIAPATADIISKTALGICSDGATTLIQSALGCKIPIVFSPTMHNSLINSPIITDNIQKLKKINHVYFIPGRQEEGKQKILSPDSLVLTFSHFINKPSKKKSVLITYGGTRVMIDPVRCVTNLSTGKLGWEVVKTFYLHGYNVHSIVANTNFERERLSELIEIEKKDYEEFYSYIKKLKTNSFSGIIHLVAASDFLPETSTTKISSKKNFELLFTRSHKIIELENIKKIPFKIICKLTDTESPDDLKKVKEYMLKNKFNKLFWNNHESAWKRTIHEGHFVTSSDRNFHLEKISGKQNIARKFLQELTDHSL